MEPFIGQIQPFGFNFAPRNWAKCNGALLPIASNTALFSLLGTTFGGDGRTTFGLPDLRGRSIVGLGSGPGLDTITWGERGGKINETLTLANIPSHHHAQQISVSEEEATQDDPNGHYLSNTGGFQYVAAPTAGKFLGSGNTSNAGGGQSFNIRNPFLGIEVCIALQGIFPSRN